MIKFQKKSGQMERHPILQDPSGTSATTVDWHLKFKDTEYN